MLSLTACGGDDNAGEQGSGGISISGVWSRPVLTAELDATPDQRATTSEDHSEHSIEDTGANGVVYMTIDNGSDEDDRLVSVETDIATAAELHNVQMDGGVMRMRQVQGIDVPAGATVSLEPGGYHVMFVGLHANLEVGDEIDATLLFERAGSITVVSLVREEAP